MYKLYQVAILSLCLWVCFSNYYSQNKFSKLYDANCQLELKNVEIASHVLALYEKLSQFLTDCLMIRFILHRHVCILFDMKCNRLQKIIFLEYWYCSSCNKDPHSNYMHCLLNFPGSNTSRKDDFFITQSNKQSNKILLVKTLKDIQWYLLSCHYLY